MYTAESRPNASGCLGWLIKKFMKRKIGLTFFLVLIAYATYIHGYYLDSQKKWFLYDVLDMMPLWVLGTYVFWPAYYVISVINQMTDTWQVWEIVGMWIGVQAVYAAGVSWTAVEAVERLRKWRQSRNRRI